MQKIIDNFEAGIMAGLEHRKASERILIWKGQEYRAAAIAFVQAGLQCGRAFFGPDDIPEGVTFSSQGILGSAVHALREAHVIEDFFGSVPEEGIVYGRRRSKRASANGRKIQLYRLSSIGAAVEFLRRNGYETKTGQLELAM